MLLLGDNSKFWSIAANLHAVNSWSNFELYLASLYRKLPWLFVLDRYNYARCTFIYWFDMELLKHCCLNAYKEFVVGNLFLKTNKQFSRMNRTHTWRVLVLVRWELCRPELCWIIEELKKVESSTKHDKKQKHHEDSPIFTKDFILRTPRHYLIISHITLPTQWSYRDQEHRPGIWRQHLMQLGTIVKNWWKTASFIHSLKIDWLCQSNQ